MATDINKLAKGIVDKTTDQNRTLPKKNPHAQALGALGGAKGGPARAAKLSKEEMVAIARKGAQTRWKKHKKENQKVAEQ